MSWREPFDLAGDRLRAIRAKYGKHALGVYYGNQAAHNLGLMLFGIPLFRSLGTRNVFAATSVDQLPQMLAAYLMLGHQGYCRCRTSIAPTCSSASARTRWYPTAA